MNSPAGENNNNDGDNNNDDKEHNVVTEISPLVSYAGEGLEAYKGQKMQLPVMLN